MVDLIGAPFAELIDRMRLEYATQKTLFDLPVHKWYAPAQDSDAPNLSVSFHGRLAGNPAGPASGPQTQMAQNIVLAWLAGARIMELKTVQVDDQLVIARPCIHAPNVGYNIEFSQELAVDDSLDQYVQGAMLVHMLRHAPEVFGHPFGQVDWQGPAGETLFDMSIGYDLAGIRSRKVQRFIEGMIDATTTIARLREQIPSHYARLRDLEYPSQISQTVTLSTFHGCPSDEIERIVEFLIDELNVDAIVKMNPPMLGKERLEHLLHDCMGYHDIRVNGTAYTSGLALDEAVGLCRRLADRARSRGRHFGAKFSNTLEVVNDRDFFPETEQVMYLSGPPLHVLTLALTDRFRQAVGPELPISFSAGVDQKNFAQMVACGFVPVTSCTDLLKTGGYGRLAAYLGRLEQAMTKLGANSVDEYILSVRNGHTSAPAGEDGLREPSDVVQAGLANTAFIASEAESDQRYWQKNNRLAPRRIDSRLLLFDCITCNKCVPVCPNDANFLYDSPDVRITFRDVEVMADGVLTECGEERHFALEREQQIANFADFCNQCGNCDTFCPEWDGPYLKKPNFHGSRRSFDATAPRDGFLLEGDQPGRFILLGRVDGQVLQLAELVVGEQYRFSDGVVAIDVQHGKAVRLDAFLKGPTTQPHRVDMGRYHAMAALLAGVTSRSRVHQVNIRLLMQSP